MARTDLVRFAEDRYGQEKAGLEHLRGFYRAVFAVWGWLSVTFWTLPRCDQDANKPDKRLWPKADQGADGNEDVAQEKRKSESDNFFREQKEVKHPNLEAPLFIYMCGCGVMSL